MPFCQQHPINSLMKRHASMNRIYRLVWSNVHKVWIPVAEIARGRSKGSSRKLFAAALSLSAAVGHTEPIGGQIISGSGSIEQSGSTTTIHQSSPEPVGQLAELQHRPQRNGQLRSALSQRHCGQPHFRHQRHANPRPLERQRPGVSDQPERHRVRSRRTGQCRRPGRLDLGCERRQPEQQFQNLFRQRHRQRRQ